MARIRMVALFGALTSLYAATQLLPISTTHGDDSTENAQSHDHADRQPVEDQLEWIQSQQQLIVDELQELRQGRDAEISSSPPLGNEDLTPDNLKNICLLATIDQFAYDVQWSGDGSQLALVPWEGRVEIRDAETLAPVSTVPFGPMTVGFDFAPVGDLVAITENDASRTVQLVDVDAGDVTALQTGAAQPKADFSPDGSYIVTSGGEMSALVWRVSDGELLHSLYIGPKQGALTPVFSPNGKVIAVGNRNSTTRLFNAETGELLHELEGKAMSQGLAFRPQGDILAVGYVDGSIGLWDVENGDLLLEQPTDADEIFNVVWSPSGEMLVTAGLRSEITFWSIPDFEAIHRLPTPEWVIALSFSPDGKRLVTSGGPQRNQLDCEVRIWGIPIESE